MKKLFFVLITITVGAIGSQCQQREFAASSVGVYTNDYDSLIVAPQPESIVLGRKSIDIRYRWGVVPFAIVGQSTKGYPVKDAEVDSIKRTFYRLVNPISGDTVSAVYMENYLKGELQRMELAIQLYSKRQKQPVLAFIKNHER